MGEWYKVPECWKIFAFDPRIARPTEHGFFFFNLLRIMKEGQAVSRADVLLAAAEN